MPRRPHPAAATRLLATGLSTSATFVIVAVLASGAPPTPTVAAQPVAAISGPTPTTRLAGAAAPPAAAPPAGAPPAPTGAAGTTATTFASGAATPAPAAPAAQGTNAVPTSTPVPTAAPVTTPTPPPTSPPVTTPPTTTSPPPP